MRDIHLMAGRLGPVVKRCSHPSLRPWMSDLGHGMEKRGRLEEALNTTLGAQ